MMLFQLELILSFHSYASRIGSKIPNVTANPDDPVAFVSIHTLHELEASLRMGSIKGGEAV